jgi:hypothetical protein
MQWKWDRMRRWLELGEHLLTAKDLIEAVIALGIAGYLRNLLVNRMPSNLLMPFWFISSGLLLWFFTWIIPKLKRRRIKPEAWCEAARSEDIGKMWQRLADVKWEVATRNFKASDPYIEFNVTFLNASVFNLTSPIIEGKAKFGNDPCSAPPELTKPFPIRRGERVWMQIRQHVSADAAIKMQELINTWQEGRNRPSLDFREIRINFDGEFLGDKPQRLTWSGPEKVLIVNPV